MSGPSRRTLLLVPLLVSACHTWRPVPLAASDSGALPARSRVVRIGGAAVEIEDGRISRDSVVGMRDAGRIAIPRDSVAFVEGRRFSAARTVGLSAGVITVAWAVLLTWVAASFAAGN